MKRKSIPILKNSVLAASAGFIMSACAPTVHPEIRAAEEGLLAVSSRPGAQSYAAREIREAEVALERSKAHWEREKDEEEALHLTYLVARRTDIARLKLSEESRERTTDALREKRKDVARDASEREATSSAIRAEIYRQEAVASRREAASLEKMLRLLKGTSTNQGLQLTVGDVLFENNRAELRPGAQRRLEPLADFLRENQGQIATIEGHTDDRGSDVWNLKLSQQRADAVKDLIASLGVSPSRLKARGLGESHPIATNKTEAGRTENRRVEIFIRDGS